MTDFQKLIDEAVEVRTDEGAVDDTLAEFGVGCEIWI